MEGSSSKGSSVVPSMHAIPFHAPIKVRTPSSPLAHYTLPPLKIQRVPIPGLCSDDEILVQVKAFGINVGDIFARRGKYQGAPPFPFVPGMSRDICN